MTMIRRELPRSRNASSRSESSISRANPVTDLAIQGVAASRRELPECGTDLPTFRDFPQGLLQVEEAVRGVRGSRPLRPTPRTASVAANVRPATGLDEQRRKFPKELQIPPQKRSTAWNREDAQSARPASTMQ